MYCGSRNSRNEPGPSKIKTPEGPTVHKLFGFVTFSAFQCFQLQQKDGDLLLASKAACSLS